MSSVEDRIRKRCRKLGGPGQAVMATYPTGEIVFWDAGAEELYGWTRDEVIGRNVVDVTPTSLSQPEAAHIMKRLRSAESWSGRFEVRDKAGESFTVEVTDSPLLDRYGKLIGIVGVSRKVPPGPRR